MEIIRDVVQQLQSTLNDESYQSVYVRYGTVQSIQTGPPVTLTVRVGGSTTNIAGIKFLQSYVPVVNDVVLMLQVGASLIVVDRIGSGPKQLYRARAHANAATALAAGAFTTVALQVEDYDPNNNFAANTYTCPIAGYYRVDFTVEALLNNNPQDYVSSVFKNGTEATRGSGFILRGGIAGDTMRSHGSDLLSCASGDTLTLRAFNNGANGVNTVAGTATSFLTVAFDSP